MDVFNRLKSAVTTVLPVGNPISGEFDIFSQKGSGGPGMLWKIFDGVQRNTKQEVSIFVFEKKLLERYTKRDRDAILEALKKGVSQLTRLRHPKILSVLHPLEDSRESLAFATEPVFCCLANVLGQHDNMPPTALGTFKDFTLFDVEIKYGLLQVVEALTFLHSSVHMVHSNVCPESIFINSVGCWKIAGFEFCIPNANAQSQSPLYSAPEWDPHLCPVAQSKLNYLAPEYLRAACDTASDMFSVGVLIYALYNGGQPVFDSMNEWSKFKSNTSQLKSLSISTLANVPMEAREHVRMLLNTESAVRPDADQLSKIPYFEDVGVMTLQYLDMLVQKDNLQKSQFFKGLAKVIDKLPKRVNIQRVFPSLCKECVNNNMIPFVLPNMLVIAEQSSETEYSKIIFPALVPLFKVNEPLQVVLIFLQNMNLLLSKTSQTDIRNHVLPMVARALEANQPQIQELCLNIIPTFAALVEYTSLKNLIIPRIRKICLAATTLSVRVNCLVCLGKIIEYLDRWYVLDEVLPMLQEIPSREPAVLMSILGIYKIALTHKKLGITKDMLALKIIPFLFPLCIDNGLNLTQFNAFMVLVKEMMSRVESEHRTKLEQLSSVQEEQRKLQQFAQETLQGNSSASTSNGTGSNDGNMMDSFLSGLGFGSFSSSGNLTHGDTKASVLDSSPSNTRSSTPVNDSKMSNRPQSLTMEEKAKLAKDQDIQLRLKSQAPIQLQTAVSSAAPTSKASLRDLSSTLSSNPGFPLPVRPTANISAASTFPSGGLQPAAGVNWGASSSFSVMASQAVVSQSPETKFSDSSKKPVDLSSFDSLLSMGSNTRVPLNNMATQPRPQSGANPFGTPIGMPPFASPGIGVMSGSGMVPAANMGSSSSFGIINHNPVGSGGITGVGPMMGPGMMYNGSANMGFMSSGSVPLIRPPTNNVPSHATQSAGSTPLSNRDIADFLG